MYGKKLAYGVKIKEIREIPGADRIELATIREYLSLVQILCCNCLIRILSLETI